jgi:hypothetical protein
MTYDHFLTKSTQRNAYVKHPDFSSLYIHKGEVGVILSRRCYRCLNTVTIANVTSKKPGGGAFARLVADLVQRGFAVKVECVHEERFQKKLLRMGFVVIEGGLPPSFLFNHDGHLEDWEEEQSTGYGGWGNDERQE